MAQLRKITNFLIFMPDWMVFLLTCFLSFFIALARGWIEYDFANYHYYNAWAFLTGQIDKDIIPNGIHHFLNPLADIPFYLFITYFNDDKTIIHALQGLWSGLYMFAAYKTGTLFFDKTKITGRAALYLLTILAIASDLHNGQIGVPSNDITSQALSLIGTYLLLKVIKQQKFSAYSLAFSGILLGASFGLKATSIIWCFASGFTLILCYKNKTDYFKTLFLFIFSGLVGYLLTNGYFMFHYWQLYQNPFFPLLNGIFKSEYYDIYNYKEIGYVPQGWEKLYFPFTWLKDPKVNEYQYHGKQIICQYAFSLLFLSSLIFPRARTYWKTHILETALQVFWLLAYIFWMLNFSVIRYVILDETLAMLIFLLYGTKIYNFIIEVIEKKYPAVKKLFDADTCYTIVMLGALYFMLDPHIGHTMWYLENNKTPQPLLTPLPEIKFPDGAIINLYNNDISYMAPLLAKYNKNLTYIGHPRNFWKKRGEEIGNKFENFGKFQQIAAQKQAENPDKIYSIINFKHYTENDGARSYDFFMKIDNNKDLICHAIITTLPKERPLICVPKDQEKEIFREPLKKTYAVTSKQGLPIAVNSEESKYNIIKESLMYCMLTNNCFSF